MSKFQDTTAEAVLDRLTKVVAGAPVNALTWRVTKHVGAPFAGGTSNAHGDHDGTGDPYTVFRVDGRVMIKAIFAIVGTTLVSASDTGTLELGVAGNTAKLIAQSTVGSGTFTAGDIWTDSGVETGVDILATSGAEFIISGGLDIIETAATNNITAGQLDYYVIWAPLDDNSNLVSA